MLLVKSPQDPEYVSSPEVAEYKATLAEHGNGLNPDQAIVTSGYLQGEMLVASMQGTDGCTRQDLLDAVYSLKDVEAGMLLPGITMNTGPEYPYLFTQAKVGTFDGTRYILDHGLVEVE